MKITIIVLILIIVVLLKLYREMWRDRERLMIFFNRCEEIIDLSPEDIPGELKTEIKVYERSNIK